MLHTDSGTISASGLEGPGLEREIGDPGSDCESSF